MGTHRLMITVIPTSLHSALLRLEKKTYWRPIGQNYRMPTMTPRHFCHRYTGKLKKSFTSLIISPEKVIWNSKGIHTFIIDLMIIGLKGWKCTTCLRHTEQNQLTLNYSFKRNVTSHGKASNEWDITCMTQFIFILMNKDLKMIKMAHCRHSPAWRTCSVTSALMSEKSHMARKLSKHDPSSASWVQELRKDKHAALNQFKWRARWMAGYNTEWQKFTCTYGL